MGDDALAVVTAGGSRPGHTEGRGGLASKVEQGHPLLAAGLR